MDESTFYRDHWVTIEPERLEVSDQLYDWPEPIVAMVLDRLGAQSGHVVVDLGCGPGYVTRAIARQVGDRGHVHGVELNANFVERRAPTLSSPVPTDGRRSTTLSTTASRSRAGPSIGSWQRTSWSTCPISPRRLAR